ncbi:hypothetical protein L249_2098 [Ophiocordyceps polyrhachis-furcata BCC 54312]|uniref:Ribosomal RNA-processing protein 15 n=1 Tax=Ophiocordyceps polyrhachis-furcata BCC 54312 TaxID=1330021 RepID=A0A367LSG5_9HYPO|nr:hypothetical protein L249_2098 [Ophiocordyceps polyrhachis-furcata BCC 54312]
MAGLSNKKRPIEGRTQRAFKKQKKRYEYHSSDSESEQGVEPIDSDHDVLDAAVDESDGNEESSSDEESSSSKQRVKKKHKPKGNGVVAADNGGQDEDESNDDDDDVDDSDSDQSDRPKSSSRGKMKSKRNDPNAFATSLSKILSTKLSSSKRPDPVLARSAAAHEVSKAAVDSALEAKARRHLKEQKRKALEEGRVRDVLLATNNVEATTSTADLLIRERKLREVAKRGVIKMFNAVRAAQIKATEADKDAKRSGVITSDRRKQKINELSKKGFLELIASGGGGLRKAALEEA